MKIARYRNNDNVTYGVLIDKSIVNLPAVAKENHVTIPETIEGFISARENALCTAESLLKEATAEQHVRLDGGSLLAPIASPPKIICLGLNYRDHAKETAATPPKEPIIFIKPRTAIIGTGETKRIGMDFHGWLPDGSFVSSDRPWDGARIWRCRRTK